jgi:DNA protecting protein DprA
MNDLGQSRRTDNLQVAYCYWLSQLASLSERSALKFKKQFPTVESWEELSQNDRLERAKAALGNDSLKIFTTDFGSAIERALNDLEEHKNAGIQIISIDSDDYPYLLKQISDPPLLLFVKGSIEAVVNNTNVAIIGTRDATSVGAKVATRIARWLGEHEWCIVSGLAKGIDTAAHKGALEAKARTVAVMATALDIVYPAENRSLAEEILDSGGCWISEMSLRKKPHRGTFVQRDRIQSGLSVAVIPVQTDIEGGTMHTVDFTQRQKRLLMCPRPIEAEQSLKQYAGIRYLVETKRATPFSAEDYEQILDSMVTFRDSLLKEWPTEQRTRTLTGFQQVTLEAKQVKTNGKSPKATRRKHPPRVQVNLEFGPEFESAKTVKSKRRRKQEAEIEVLEQLVFEVENAKHPDGRNLSGVDDVKEWLQMKIKALKQH